MNLKLTIPALFALILTLCGCGETSDAPIPTPPTNHYKDFVYIPLDGAPHVTRLNAWLHENPNKKIVGFHEVYVPKATTKIVVTGYIVRYSEGSNRNQRFMYLGRDDPKKEGPAVYGMADVVLWLEANTIYSLTDFTIVPDNDGKVIGYILCYEQKP